MFYAAIESYISEALLSIVYKQNWKFTNLAKEFEVSFKQLQNCYQCWSIKTNCKGGNKRFSKAQKLALCQYLDWLDTIRLPARILMLVGAANAIIQMSCSNDSNSFPLLGN